MGATHVRAPRLTLGASLLALAAAGCSSGSAALTPSTSAPGSARSSATASAGRLPHGKDGTVDRVVDGDTIIVDRLRIRLIGIDAPESVKPDSPVQCYGPEASAELHLLLPVGTHVRLERDIESKDRYGRTLAYVWRVDPPLDVDVELARLGYARVLTIRPNVAHRREIAAAVQAAQGARRGLWSACS